MRHLLFTALLALAFIASDGLATPPPDDAAFESCPLHALSCRFDSEIRAHRWTPTDLPDPPAIDPLLSSTSNPIPFSIIVRDFSPPDPEKHLPTTLNPDPEPLLCRPERMACSDDAFSLYGGILRPGPPSVLPPFEWQLLTDSRTPTRTFHFQIAAPDGPDRFIEIDFLMGPFDPDDPPRLPPLRHSAGYIGPVHADMIVPYLSDYSPPVALVLDPAEPRDVAALYSHGNPVGLRVRLALTSATSIFPRSATVAFAALPIEPRTYENPFILCPPDLPHAPDMLPVPQHILDGDLDDVPVFTPCKYDAPVPPDDLFEHLGSLPDSEWATSASQCHALNITFSPLAAKSYDIFISSDIETLKPTRTFLYVNPDPELETASGGPNRALAILHAIDALPAPPPAVILRFDAYLVNRFGPLTDSVRDYSTNALRHCDFPATWFPSDTCFGGPRPGVSLSHAAAEFTAALSCLLHRRAIPIVVSHPPHLAPYLAYHADADIDLDKLP